MAQTEGAGKSGGKASDLPEIVTILCLGGYIIDICP